MQTPEIVTAEQPDCPSAPVSGFGRTDIDATRNTPRTKILVAISVVARVMLLRLWSAAKDAASLALIIMTATWAAARHMSREDDIDFQREMTGISSFILSVFLWAVVAIFAHEGRFSVLLTATALWSSGPLAYVIRWPIVGLVGFLYAGCRNLAADVRSEYSKSLLHSQQKPSDSGMH